MKISHSIPSILLYCLFISCFLFVLWPSLYQQSSIAPALHLAKSTSVPAASIENTPRKKESERHTQSYKLKLYRTHAFTHTRYAASTHRHATHNNTKAMGNSSVWLVRKQANVVFDVGAILRKWTHFFRKKARGVYVNVYVCVCTSEGAVCVSVNWGVFIPEVVVFHLFLHQFCPVGGKRCVRVLEDPNSFAQVKKTERKRKRTFFFLCGFFL